MKVIPFLQLFSEKNKKVIEKMKDEPKGRLIKKEKWWSLARTVQKIKIGNFK